MMKIFKKNKKKIFGDIKKSNIFAELKFNKNKNKIYYGYS